MATAKKKKKLFVLNIFKAINTTYFPQLHENEDTNAPMYIGLTEH